MHARVYLWLGGISLSLLVLGGCSVAEVQDYPYPKASDDADSGFALQSNKERTHFFIDGKEVGVGRKLKIRVSNQGHTVVAKPDGCKAKEEFVQPPYSVEVPLSFTFVLGECEERVSSVAPTTPHYQEKEPPLSQPAAPRDGKELPMLKEVLEGSGDRTALVIGNSEYGDLGRLRNPVNDARDMASILRRLGFSVVLELNRGQEQMEDAIVEFGKSLRRGGVGLFYFAGHAVQVDGRNYLIPVGAMINSQKDVRYKAVDLGQVLDEMYEAGNGLNIVVLDACRDNPLPRSVRSGAGRGLTRVDAPRGTFIAFATSPGSVAQDGEGRNGIFTKHVLKNIRLPGLSLEQVFKKVLQGVDWETRGNQTPWSSSSFTGDFYFMQ